MSETGTISEIELLAFVDGKISPDSARYREIEDILNRQPALADRVAAYRQQNAALTRAYSGIADQPAPAWLLDVLNNDAGRRQSRFTPRMRMAASLAAVLISGGLGWYAGGLGDQPDIDTTALMDVVRDGGLASMNNRAPGAAGAAFDLATTVGAGAVDRAALEIPAPDLAREGFTFVSRARITRSDREVLALTYRNPDNESVRILIAPRLSQPHQPIRLERQGDLSMGYWTEGGLAIALIGRLDTADTRALAESVRRKTEIRLADDMPAPVIRHMPVEQEANALGAPEATRKPDPVTPTQPVSETLPEGG